MSSYSDYANAAANILTNKGAALGQAAANKGNLWGSTIANLGQVVPQQVQQVMHQVAEKKKLAQIQQIIQESQGDLSVAGPKILSIDPKFGAEVLKLHGEIQESTARVQKMQTESAKALQDYSDDQWDRVIDEPTYIRAVKVDQMLGTQHPPEYNPAYVTKIQENNRQRKLKAKAPEDFTLSEGQSRFSPTGEPLATVPKTAPPKADYTIGAQRFSGTTNEVLATGEKPEAVITPYQQAQLDLAQKNFGLSQQRLALAIKNANKSETDKAKSGLAQTVMNHPELFAQLTAGEKGAISEDLDRMGFKEFKKPLSATMENRLASAKAVVQTGDDITSQLKDPKIAAMLGPAMGRYNNLREFIGDPPPEVSELAGNIGSFALAQMGVHGMRNAEMAKQIESMLDAKHTPESLAARIAGINKFANHLLENEGRSAGPKVGDLKTFPNGNKGRWDGKGWELVK